MSRDSVKKSYLFTGYYGFKNFGDDLFPVACDFGVDKFGGDSKAVILAPPIAGVNANFLVPGFLARIYRRGSFMGRLLRVSFLVYGAIRYRRVVLAGGSTIASGSSMAMRRVQFLMASLGVCKLYAIGVSVGPFDNRKDIGFARRFIDILNFLSVRDNSSQDECKLLGVKVIPDVCNDLVGALPFESIVGVNKADLIESPVIGVSICRYESIVGGDISIEASRNIAIIHGVARFAKKNGYKVLILVLNSSEDLGDFSVSSDLNRYLLEHEIKSELVPYKGPLEMVKVIDKCDIFCSVRLHGAICAYLLNIPFLLVEYHRKCSDFLESIGKSQELRLPNNIVDDGVVVEALEAISNSKELTIRNSEDYKKKSLENFSFLKG